jgi:hypothetical protein
MFRQLKGLSNVAGLRVIRGGATEGGQCHVGTVVGGAKDDGCVEVTWDDGKVASCKAGELLVLDNAPIGKIYIIFFLLFFL